MLVLTEETMLTPGSASSRVRQSGQAWPRVQFRQMTEMNMDASALEELTRMAAQSRAMMNREGEAHLHVQQWVY
eukprot:12882962-Prorocentrum_lima.AAC.1